MGITEQLDNLREQLSGCDAVVLADLETGMPLCASTRLRLPQEHIDQLTDTATLLLADTTAALTSAPTRMAILLDGAAVEIFLRGAGPATEVLCCNLATRTDLAPVVTEMERILPGIAGQQ